jgi:hypothetical protein
MTKTEAKLIARLAAAKKGFPCAGYEGKREEVAARALAAKGLVKMTPDSSVSHRRMGSGSNLYQGLANFPQGRIEAI